MTDMTDMTEKDNKTNNPNYDVNMNSRLDQMLHSGRERMNQIMAMQRDAIRYVYGDQHAGKKRKKGWEYPVINRMYSDLMQEVAILSANNPRIDTLPTEDTDIETAKSCGMVLKGLWSGDLHMRIKVIQGLMDDHLSGVKIAKTFFEPMSEWQEDEETGGKWKGRIEVNIIRPDYFGCDPDVELAIEIPTKARYVWTERWVDKQWAAQRWKKYKRYLIDKGQMNEKGEIIEGDEGTTATGTGQTNETHFNRSTYAWSGREKGSVSEEFLQSRLSDLVLGETRDGMSATNPKDKSLVCVQEFYFRDYATEKVPAQMEDWPMGEGDAARYYRNPNSSYIYDKEKPLKRKNETTGEEEIYGYDIFDEEKETWPQREKRASYEKPKYPNGRVAIRIDQECLAEDRAWEYKRWPFAVSSCYLLPHMWQGVNCVELSRGFQDWMNNIASHMTNYIKFFGDPQLWIEDGALAKDKSQKKSIVANWAGGITKFAKGALRSGSAMIHQPPPLPGTLFEIWNILDSCDKDLKGIHDVAQGKASKGDITLGEVELLNRNTLRRIALQGAFLDEWLKQIAGNVIELMQTHLEVDEWVRWSGEESQAKQAAIQWTQAMADAKFDIALEPVSTLPYDEEREVMKYLQIYKTVGPAMMEELLKKMKIQNFKEILMKHELAGPLTTLMEMAAQMQIPPEQLMAAVQAQLQLLQELSGPAQPEPGKGPPPETNQAPKNGPMNVPQMEPIPATIPQ